MIAWGKTNGGIWRRGGLVVHTLGGGDSRESVAHLQSESDASQSSCVCARPESPVVPKDEL